MTLSQFRPSLCSHLRIFQELIDYLDMGYEHSSTAVSSDSQLVEHFLGFVASSHSLVEGFPFVGDLLAASEASHWDYHRATIYLYDFCFRRRALGPPNFLGSATLWSPAIMTLSYARKVFLNSLPFVQPANALAIAMRAASA